MTFITVSPTKKETTEALAGLYDDLACAYEASEMYEETEFKGLIQGIQNEIEWYESLNYSEV